MIYEIFLTFLATGTFFLFYNRILNGESETYEILIIMGLIAWMLFNVVYDNLHNLSFLPYQREIYYGLIYGLAVILGTILLHKFNNWREDKE